MSITPNMTPIDQTDIVIAALNTLRANFIVLKLVRLFGKKLVILNRDNNDRIVLRIFRGKTYFMDKTNLYENNTYGG